MIVHSLVLTLCYVPIFQDLSLLHAQEIRDQHVVQDNTMSQFRDMIGAITSQIQNQRAQMMAMQQAQQLQRNLMPQTGPARFFPQCQLPAVTPVPVGACETPIQSDHEVMMYETLRQGANVQVNFMEGMLNTAKNTPPQSGIQCLQDRKHETMSQLNARLNGLTNLMDQMDKRNQLFRDRASELLDDLRDDYGLLVGAARGRLSNDTMSIDHSSNFSLECQNVLSQQDAGEINQVIFENGFNGLRLGLQGDRNQALNFASNKSSIQEDINQSINHIQDVINRHGLEPGNNQSFQELITSYASSHESIRTLAQSPDSPLVRLLSSEATPLISRKLELQQELQSQNLDYTIPRMDQHFQRNFDINNLEEIFRKRYVNRCVNNQGQMNVINMTQSDILGSLTHPEFGRNAPIVRNFRAALENILNHNNPNVYIEDQIAELRRLYESYGGNIDVEYSNSEGRRESRPIYQLYGDLVNRCNRHYTSSQDLRDSEANEVRRMTDQLRDFKQNHQNFNADLGSKISDKLIRCDGRELTSGPGFCQTDIFNPSNRNFCINHAEQCSNHITQCYNQVEKKYNDTKTRIDRSASEYNAAVESFVADQERQLAVIKQRLIEEQARLEQFFPGAHFQLADELFIEMPPEVDEFGVKIRGGSEYPQIAMRDLSEKLSTLRGQYEDQMMQVQNVINEYIQEQEQNLYRNKDRWQRLADNCDMASQQYAQQQMENYREQTQAFNQRASEVSDFCNRFHRLTRMNPNAACSGFVSELFESSLSAAGNISGDAIHAINEYNNLCARTQNETRERDRRRDSTRDAIEDLPSELLAVCTSFSEDWDRGIREIARHVGRQINIHHNDIMTYAKNGSSANISTTQAHDHSDILTSFRRLYQNTLENRRADDFESLVSDICSDDEECFERILSKYDLDGTRVQGYNGDNANFCDTARLESEVQFLRGNETPTPVELRENSNELRAQDFAESSGHYYAANSDLRFINSFLRSRGSSASRDLASIDREWTRLGEHAQTISCHAQEQQQRGFADFLRVFDQTTGGAHAIGSPPGSTNGDGRTR